MRNHRLLPLLGDQLLNLADLKQNIKEAVACHFEEGEMPAEKVGMTT